MMTWGPQKSLPKAHSWEVAELRFEPRQYTLESVLLTSLYSDSQEPVGKQVQVTGKTGTEQVNLCSTSPSGVIKRIVGEMSPIPNLYRKEETRPSHVPTLEASITDHALGWRSHGYHPAGISCSLPPPHESCTKVLHAEHYKS